MARIAIIPGGGRRGRPPEATVLDRATSEMPLARDEAFAPPYCCDDLRQLRRGARDRRRHPLRVADGAFTDSLDTVMHLARRLQTGGVTINEGSNSRIDRMPFGGISDSRTGRESVRNAIEEFTHSGLVALSFKPPR